MCFLIRLSTGRCGALILSLHNSVPTLACTSFLTLLPFYEFQRVKSKYRRSNSCSSGRVLSVALSCVTVMCEGKDVSRSKVEQLGVTGKAAPLRLQSYHFRSVLD